MTDTTDIIVTLELSSAAHRAHGLPDLADDCKRAAERVRALAEWKAQRERGEDEASGQDGHESNSHS
jgi:hypothetical protein